LILHRYVWNKVEIDEINDGRFLATKIPEMNENIKKTRINAEEKSNRILMSSLLNAI
jgi:hypothetical protein